MVGDDQEHMIRQLTSAERPSPPVYNPARDLFIRVLQGDFSIQRALAETKRLHDETERKCAHDVLVASESFLAREPPAKVGRLDSMEVRLPNGMQLVVSPVWIRHLVPQPRLMILHFWQRPLSDWQLSAAAAILVAAMKRDNPACLSLDIDFLSVAIPDYSAGRRLRVYDWYTLKPLDDEGLSRFFDRLCEAWAAYQRREPRVIKSRHNRSLLDV
jgi:hypothetical protein